MQGLEAGQKFERYRVLRLLGSGVSGESYEAEDLLLQRKVLLKLIHPWLILSDSVRRQFFREMQYSSSITHPYLATILDYGEVDTQLYLVRRFIDLGSLLSNDGRTRFAPPLASADAITYIHQLAQGLQHLHNYGLAHGSLTFSNIMVLGNPTLDKTPAPFVLTDIGTACFVRRFGLPKISLLPITAAPEQMEKRIVPAGDQYSLATLLYFWLAGRPPFLGTSDVQMQQKLTETITPLASLNSSITAKQEEIIHRALSSTPEKRYPSILAFAEALMDSLQQPAYHTSPDKATPQLSHDPAITNPPTTPTSTHQSDEHHTDELSQVEREIQLISPNDQDEEYSIQENQDIGAGSETSSAFESLLNSLKRDSSPPFSYHTMPDSDCMLNTEPAWQGELVTEPGPQNYLSTMPDAEINILLNSIDFQEPAQEQVQPPSQIESDIPQPFPQSENTSEAKPQSTQKNRPEPSPDAQLAQDVQKIVPRLIITSHYQTEPREVPLEQEIITLGRAGSSDILLDYDNLTSRHHALLKYERDQYVIFDQRSAQGTSVNGQKLAVGVGWRLTDGDCITIGAYRLVFQHQSSQDDDIHTSRSATTPP
jgi:serine/threonine protein kinase